jgi:hypothetical protein
VSNTFVLLNREQLLARYGEFYASAKKVKLDEANIPKPLRPLIPYAEIWGISDDGYREELAESAPAVAREDLIAIVDEFNTEFDRWLTGPEADLSEQSEEYVAFSAMRMVRYYL